MSAARFGSLADLVRSSSKVTQGKVVKFGFGTACDLGLSARPDPAFRWFWTRGGRGKLTVDPPFKRVVDQKIVFLILRELPPSRDLDIAHANLRIIMIREGAMPVRKP